jgi:dGTP triphosphohydrolase
MTSKLTKLLAATGIVQLEAEAEELPPAVPAEAAEAASAETGPSLAPEAGVVAERKPFDELYRAASVPPSPFAAEKLLKLLDGLATLPMDVRKQMVKAMDEADDSWTIDDVVLDAQRKIKVLTASKQVVAQQAAAAAKNAESEIAAINRRQAESTAQIRRQITELNALLERESTKAVQAAAEVNAQSRSNQEAGVREAARLDAEISRLNQIPTHFAGTPSA